MSDSNRLPRRKLLEAIGVSSIGVIAGCNESKTETDTTLSADGSATPTETVVFTDTTTNQTTVTSTTEGETATRVFDGGDSRAFRNALEELVRNPGATLEIDPGTYRFSPPAGSDLSPHFTVETAKDVVIDGHGAKLVFTDPLRSAFAFHGGEDIGIRNVTIDYDPVPFTQGKIIGLSNDNQTVRLDLDQGFPDLTHELFSEAKHVGASIHSSDGSYISADQERSGGATLRIASITRIEDRKFEIRLKYREGTQELSEGRKVLIGARNQAGVSFTNTDRLRLDGVTIRTAPGMAINAEQCDDAVVAGSTIAPPPGSNRGIGPIADGIHFSHCRSGPQINGCELEQLRDDGIVVNSHLAEIVEIPSEKTVAVGQNGKIPVDVGDELAVISPSGVRKGTLPRVRKVTYRKTFDADWVLEWPELIAFEESIDDRLEIGDQIANNDHANNDFEISNCTIRESTANAIRLAAGEGLVENNEIDGTGWRGISLRCDTLKTRSNQRWCNDILIRGNRIVRTGRTYFVKKEPAGIHLEHNPPQGYRREGQAHRNIEIKRNDIRSGGYLGVEIGDTKNIEILGNAFNDLNQKWIFNAGGFGLGVQNGKDISVRDNRVTGSDDSLYQFGWKHEKDSVTTSGNNVKIDGNSVTPEFITWTPIHIAFDQIVRPEGGDRLIAFKCADLSLVDETESVVMSVEIGPGEMPVLFGDGVYSLDSESGEMWRWFGGEEAQATIFVVESDLREASHLRMSGTPAAEGISASIRIDGASGDEITFGSPQEWRTYELGLPSETTE